MSICPIFRIKMQRYFKSFPSMRNRITDLFKHNCHSAIEKNSLKYISLAILVYLSFYFTFFLRFFHTLFNSFLLLTPCSSPTKKFSLVNFYKFFMLLHIYLLKFLLYFQSSISKSLSRLKIKLTHQVK